MADAKNPFGEGFEEAKSGEFVKWEKVGQQLKGILIGVEHRESSINPGEMQKIYTIEQEDKTEVLVGGRKSIDSMMKKVVLGQWVGFLYAEDKPSKKKGYNAFKLVKVYPGQMDENYTAIPTADSVENVPFED